MRQRVSVDALHATAVKQIRATDRSVQIPSGNLFTLDDPLREDAEDPLKRIPPPA